MTSAIGTSSAASTVASIAAGTMEICMVTAVRGITAHTIAGRTAPTTTIATTTTIDTKPYRCVNSESNEWRPGELPRALFCKLSSYHVLSRGVGQIAGFCGARIALDLIAP